MKIHTYTYGSWRKKEKVTYMMMSIIITMKKRSRYDQYISNTKRFTEQLTSPKPCKNITADLPELQFWEADDVDMAAAKYRDVTIADESRTLRVIDIIYAFRAAVYHTTISCFVLCPLFVCFRRWACGCLLSEMGVWKMAVAFNNDGAIKATRAHY